MMKITVELDREHADILKARRALDPNGKSMNDIVQDMVTSYLDTWYDNVYLELVKFLGKDDE